MSAKAIREATGKDLLNRFLCSGALVKSRFAVVDQNSDWQKIVEENPWLLKEVSSLLFITFVSIASLRYITMVLCLLVFMTYCLTSLQVYFILKGHRKIKRGERM